MELFGVQLELEAVRDARAAWSKAKRQFESDVDLIMARLLNEAAVNYMSVPQISKASGLTPTKVRALMRKHNLNPKRGKRALAAAAATALQENSALLGIEPHEMDLMSPLAYLPMGSDLRQELSDHEHTEHVAGCRLCPPVSGNKIEWCRECGLRYDDLKCEHVNTQTTERSVSGNEVTRGYWRHKDGTPCSSYPDSLNFTYAPEASVACNHGFLRCYTRDEL